MHTRSIVFKTLLAALLAATMLTPASVALGYEPPVGCTPGYWKNHPDMWNKFDPYTSTVGDMFSAAWARFPQLADDPLIEALRYKGGPGLEGGARIMLRAAVAGALTNLLPDFDFSLLVLGRTQNELWFGTRETMLAWASEVDYHLNLYECPL